jgi:hypothetical protein
VVEEKRLGEEKSFWLLLEVVVCVLEKKTLK